MDAQEDCGCSQWSDRAIAIVGLVIGFGVLIMAADLLTGGAITRSMIPARKLAEVIEFPGSDDATA